MPLANKMAEIWSSLEQFINPATVMAEWRAVLGADFVNTQPFLWSNGEQAEEYPCTNDPTCACDHEIIVHAPDRLVAACRCDPAECKAIHLQPKDVLIYALDSRKFCRAIRATFNFYAPQDERALPFGAPHAWPVGAYGALHSPVYLIIRQSEQEFLKEVEGLITGQAEPFILLAPTKRHLTPIVNAVLQRQKAIIIPLSCTLTLDGPGRFKMTTPIKPILDRFAKVLAEGKGLAEHIKKNSDQFHAISKKVDETPLRTAALFRSSMKQKLGKLGNVVEKDFTASPHFTNMTWRGKQYVIRRHAAVIIETLYIAQKSWDTPGLHQKEVFSRVYGSNTNNWPSSNTRIQNFFRNGDAKRLWDDGLIGHDGKGNFHLNIKIHT